MEPDDLLRRSRILALAGFLLALTSLLLPWFVVTWDNGTTAVRESVRPFSDHRPLTNAWGPWASGLAVAAACLLLFVRTAAASHRHEPAAWRRDAGLAALLVAVAAAAAVLWPEGVPSFWGGRTHSLANATGPSTVETALPGIGWWAAVAAALLAAGAWWLARRATASRPPAGP